MPDPRPPAPRTRPPERYGDTRSPLRRRLLLLAVGVLAVGGVAFVVWAGLHAATPPVRASVVGFDPAGTTSLRVRVEVVKGADAVATCRVLVRDDSAAVVGAEALRVGPETGRRGVVAVTVEGSAPPVTAEVDCSRS